MSSKICFFFVFYYKTRLFRKFMWCFWVLIFQWQTLMLLACYFTWLLVNSFVSTRIGRFTCNIICVRSWVNLWPFYYYFYKQNLSPLQSFESAHSALTKSAWWVLVFNRISWAMAYMSQDGQNNLRKGNPPWAPLQLLLTIKLWRSLAKRTIIPFRGASLSWSSG